MMITPLARAVMASIFALAICFSMRAAAQNRAADDPRNHSLSKLLTIEWRRGSNLPQGFQDSDGGIIHDHLVTVGGFCSGGLEVDNRRKPGIYPRGFLKRAWCLDLNLPESRWENLPDFPGAARQGLSAATVGESLYIWGGFSYTEPFCYRDGWRLSRVAGQWRWSPLPNFPWPINSVALCAVGTRIYAFGGSDYNAQRFFTDHDREGNRNRLGARLLVLNTNELNSGWRELNACPGTPRWVHTISAIDDQLYVIGGATGDTVRDGKNHGYCTVVDNWRFDTKQGNWTRLVDLPIASGNFPRSTNNVFRNRYIILPGGYQYGCVLSPDGRIGKPYGEVGRANEQSGLCNDVFVYDARSGRFGRADSMPIDNNLPMTVVRGDQIYLIGGETGGGMVDGEYYGHHPDLLLIGTIKESGDGRSSPRPTYQCVPNEH